MPCNFDGKNVVSMVKYVLLEVSSDVQLGKFKCKKAHFDIRGHNIPDFQMGSIWHHFWVSSMQTSSVCLHSISLGQVKWRRPLILTVRYG